MSKKYKKIYTLNILFNMLNKLIKGDRTAVLYFKKQKQCATKKRKNIKHNEKENYRRRRNQIYF